MEEQKQKHPLDDESVTVLVQLIHEATGVTAEGLALTSPAGTSVTETINRAAESAMDALLAELEVIGV